MTVTAMRDDSGTLAGFIGIARDITEERRAEMERARFQVERAAREAAERAVERLTRLHALALALADALDRAQVVNAILQQAMTALGACAGVIALLRDASTLEIAASSGYPAEATPVSGTCPVTAALPLAEVVQSRVPLLVERVEVGSRYGRLVEARLATCGNAMIASPLLLDGRVLGSWYLTFDRPRAFGEEDRLFLLAIGHASAQALERSRLYEAEARARAEAESANRTKDDLLAVLSHELRTPLTAVMGWAHILRTRPVTSTTLRRGLEIIERNAVAQVHLVEDLLDVSRIVTGKLSLACGDLDLGEVVKAAVDAATPVAEAAGVTLTTTLDASVGATFGDADRLQQVVGNLLGNAIKFTPRGGRIDARLDRLDGQARLRITDTGAGITPELLPHVFERFRQGDGTSKRAHRGLGLGLSIVQHLVELHGGKVLVESQGSGRGTTFTVLLPLCAHEPTGGAAPYQPTPADA